MRLLRCLLVALGALMWVGSASAQPYTSEFGNGGVIKLLSLKRSGSDSVVFKGVIENNGPSYISLGELLVSDGHNTQSFSVALQEPVAKKEYQQVKIDGECVGSRHNRNDTLSSKGKISVWGRITAPPPEVEKVTVVFGGSVPPIEDVPLQK